VFTLVVIVQAMLLAIALIFTPSVIALLAPGFPQGGERFTLAVELTRITFPYLLLISLVTLYGGILNALGRFASAAAAPILLNLSMMAALSFALFFPTAGHAAAWGVLIAGCLEVALLATDASRQGVLPGVPLAAARPGAQALPQAVRAGHAWLRGHSSGAVRRHHHRQLPRRRRAVGALLR
jgi:putative peptidoglycan lipid II flippase